MTYLGRSLLHIPLTTFIIGTLGCSDNEAPSEDHTPVTYEVLVNGVPDEGPYTLASGETVRVRLKFFNADDEDLDDVENTHFAGLTFDPASLASAVRVVGHSYQFDVTGGTPAAGTVTVGYGHDETADEHSFPPAPLTVTGP